MTLDASTRPKVLIGALGGVVVLYLIVNMLILAPRTELRRKYSQLVNKSNELQQEEKKLTKMRERWRLVAGATLPAADAANEVSALLTELLDKHSLGQRTVQPKMGRPLPRTHINVISCTLNAQGTLDQVVDFLRDLYEQPILKKVPTLSLSPRDPTGGGRDVKLIMEVETLVFPQERTLVPNTPVMKPEEMKNRRPIQPVEFTAADYGIIADRNLFAAYEDPPQSVITIANEDREPVSVLITGSWRGSPTTTMTLDIPSKQSKESGTVLGDQINIAATYKDKHVERTQFTDTRRFATDVKALRWVVKSHTPAPPEWVDVAVVNSDEAPIEVGIRMQVGEQTVELASVKVQPGKTQKLEKRKTPQMVLTAHYDGGGTHGPETFRAAGTPYTFRVPPKPLPAPIVDKGPTLPPADPNLRVTGGWVPIEMIATDDTNKERRVEYKVDGDEKVDGGDMIYFHRIGGIVRMPVEPVQYFLYPLGAKFTDRILLKDVKVEEDLPAAIRVIEDSDQLKDIIATTVAPAAPGGPGANGRPLTPGQPPRFERGGRRGGMK